MATQATPRASAPEHPPLTLDNLRSIFERTAGPDGKPDFSHQYPYYAPGVRFRDSVQSTVGKPALIGICERLATRCDSLNMEIVDASQTGNLIFMQWVMTMEFSGTPSTPLYGCTKLTLDAQGRIAEQRDYYDLWGDIFDVVPVFGKLYRRFMSRVFG